MLNWLYLLSLSIHKHGNQGLNLSGEYDNLVGDESDYVLHRIPERNMEPNQPFDKRTTLIFEDIISLSVQDKIQEIMNSAKQETEDFSQNPEHKETASILDTVTLPHLYDHPLRPLWLKSDPRYIVEYSTKKNIFRYLCQTEDEMEAMYAYCLGVDGAQDVTKRIL